MRENDLPEGWAHAAGRASWRLPILIVFGLIFALVAGITLLGDPHAGDPVARIDLHLAPRKNAKAAPQPAVLRPNCPPGRRLDGRDSTASGDRAAAAAGGQSAHAGFRPGA